MYNATPDRSQVQRFFYPLVIGIKIQEPGNDCPVTAVSLIGRAKEL